MADGTGANGRQLALESGETLARLRVELPGLAGKVDAKQIAVWQEKIKMLVDDLDLIKEKMFLGTRDGAIIAQSALEKVHALEDAVNRGIMGLPANEACWTVAKAMEAMATDFGGLIERTRSQTIP